jgi:GTPase SAR1 family protein
MAFPVKLLEASNTERLDYFYNFTMAHPILLDADREIRRRLTMKTTEPLIFVVGPTGCGKTTMIRKLQKTILDATMREMELDPDFLPTAWVETPVFGKRVFDWHGFLKRCLLEMKNPLSANHIRKDPADANPTLIKITEYNLQLALINTFKFRRTDHFIIDEANRLTKVSSAASLYQQIEIIRFLAGDRTRILLFGTYELLNLWKLSGQLARRTRIINLRRYDAKRTEDAQIMADIVMTFQEHLPIKIQPNLLHNLEFMWYGCIGIIGILKKWLYNCLHEALETGQKTITMAILKRNMPSPGELKSILDEILVYEQQLRDDFESDYTSVAASMGIILNNVGDPAGIEETERKDSNAIKSGRRRRPGERKPARDQIGAISAR